MAGMADLQQWWQFGPQVQGRLFELQRELADRTVEGSAGAGLVRVVADARGTVRAVHIDPDAFAGRDAELLGDLVLGAVADAQRKAADLVQSEMLKLQPLNPLGAALQGQG